MLTDRSLNKGSWIVGYQQTMEMLTLLRNIDELVLEESVDTWCEFQGKRLDEDWRGCFIQFIFDYSPLYLSYFSWFLPQDSVLSLPMTLLSFPLQTLQGHIWIIMPSSLGCSPRLFLCGYWIFENRCIDINFLLWAFENIIPFHYYFNRIVLEIRSWKKYDI